MKILMVVGQFYPTIGGAERQCLALSRFFVRAGHRVTVVTTWYNHHLRRSEMIDGVAVHRIWYPLLQMGRRRIGLGFLAPFCMTAAIFLRTHSYDVIHVHQALWPAFSAAIAARLRRKPIICKIGNSGIRFDLDQLRRGHWYGRFAAWFLKRTITKFVWTSTAVLNDLQKEGIGEQQRIFIPNGVDVPVLSTPSHTAGARVQFIFTGTFTLKKNLMLLFDAVMLLPEVSRARVHVVLLGDGPDRAALVQKIQERGLQDVMTLKGPVDDVRPALLQSDVFVLPSHTEGLSNSALEAMAHGLPLILSDAGGNHDLVSTEKEDCNGILIDHRAPQALTQAMQYMIEHPEERKRMGEYSRRRIEKQYAMEKVVAAYAALYQRLL